jgi:uncharacterized damage-inducible protein DinB
MDPRYPIGYFEPQPFSEAQRKAWLVDLAQLPNRLEGAILNLDEAQLHTPYRDGGWTVHQVVHHIADSHINAFCRMKLTLSEENPAIRPYEENDWIQQADVELPVNISITLLHALHLRMHKLMSSVAGVQWERTYVHPATGKQSTLWNLLGLYAWHGRHHVAHINALRDRKGW